MRDIDHRMIVAAGLIGGGEGRTGTTATGGSPAPLHGSELSPPARANERRPRPRPRPL